MPIINFSTKTKFIFKVITFVTTLVFMIFVLSPLADIYPTDDEITNYQNGIDITVLEKYESLIENEILNDITPFINDTLTILDGPQEIWNSRPGIAVFDYYRDGDQDFVVSNGYGHSNWLYQNDGEGNFIEVGKEAGISLKNRNNTGVVACDFDNNGYQDLYIGAQGSLTDGLDFRSNIEANQNEDSLLINNGDGTFTDITNTAFTNNVNIRSAMTIACSDINNDGWVDIYVGNLGEDEYRKMSVPYQAGHYNMMYLNNGNMTFTEIGEKVGVRGPEIKLLDLNGDPITYTDSSTNVVYEAYNPEQKDRNGNLVGDPTGQTHSVLFFDLQLNSVPFRLIATKFKLSELSVDTFVEQIKTEVTQSDHVAYENLEPHVRWFASSTALLTKADSDNTDELPTAFEIDGLEYVVYGFPLCPTISGDMNAPSSGINFCIKNTNEQQKFILNIAPQKLTLECLVVDDIRDGNIRLPQFCHQIKNNLLSHQDASLLPIKLELGLCFFWVRPFAHVDYLENAL